MTKKDNDMIVKSNDLVEASYKLTSGEQKLILKIVSEIHPDDDEFKVYKIHISEFVKLLNVKNKNIYSDIKQMTRELMTKVFTIKKPKSTLQINWLSSVEYMEGQGIVEICFDPKLKPYLLQLKNRFTKYNFSDVVQLKSFYSLRFYELLKQYEPIGKRSFEVDELKRMLGIKDDEYKLYAHFKSRAIIPAQKELREKTDISFDFIENKEGKKVKILEFIINSNKNRNLENIEQIDIECYEINSLAKLFHEETGVEFPIDDLEELVKEKGYDLVKEYFINAKKFNYSKTPVGFFIKAIKEDWKIPIQMRNPKKNKVPQQANFEQRKYEEGYLESLYANS
ncbi:MAG TPA: replication initiation protein [Clostridium sp.]|nr:replication initiation protein [Clostridium sp.]